jgi:hypothetical protein
MLNVLVAPSQGPANLLFFITRQTVTNIDMAGSCSNLALLTLVLVLSSCYMGAAAAGSDTPVQIGGTIANGLSHRRQSILSHFTGVPSASLRINSLGATRPLLGRLNAAQPTGSSSSSFSSLAHLTSSSPSEALASSGRAESYQQHGSNLLRRFLAETASTHWQAAATAATKPGRSETGPANGMNAAVFDDSIEVDW